MWQMYSISERAAERETAGQTAVLVCRGYNGSNGQFIPLLAANFLAVSLSACASPLLSKNHELVFCYMEERGDFLARMRPRFALESWRMSTVQRAVDNN